MAIKRVCDECKQEIPDGKPFFLVVITRFDDQGRGSSVLQGEFCDMKQASTWVHRQSAEWKPEQTKL